MNLFPPSNSSGSNQSPKNSYYVPIVIESDGRGERSFDIYSRLLKDRIIFIGKIAIPCPFNEKIFHGTVGVGVRIPVFVLELFSTFRTMANCTVIPVPAHSDNYMYLIVDNETKQAAAVDPVDIDAIQKAAAANEATINTILTTHNHWDHSGRPVGSA